jgi:hypothetical protein
MSRYRHHLYALLGYLALTLVMTYPLVRELGRAIPGDGFDGWQNVWNLWWVKRALLVEGTNPYFTRFIDYPNGVYLYFHTLNIFNGLTFLPVSLGAGLLVAYDAAVVFSFVVGGYGAYLLALYVIRQATQARNDPPAGQNFTAENAEGAKTTAKISANSALSAVNSSPTMRKAQLAAFVGGAIFTFSPYHMAHLLGHMQLISLEWIPFYALFVVIQIDKSANRQVSGQPSNVKRQASPARAAQPGRANVQSLISNLQSFLLPALCLVFVATCDWYYAFYMALFTGLYLLWTIVRRRTWRPVLAVAATGLLFVVATSPVLVPMIRESLASDYMVPPADSAERLSADLTAFVTPSELNPVWGGLVKGWANGFTATTSERTVFVGYSVLALAILAVWNRRRAAGFWGVSALAFAVLALGPVLHVGGQDEIAGVGPIPMPYALLRLAIPFLKISRSVSRFDVVVMLCLAVLAALGLSWLLDRAAQVPGNAPAKQVTLLDKGLYSPPRMQRSRRKPNDNSANSALSEVKNLFFQQGQQGPGRQRAVWLAAGALALVGLEFWVAPYPLSYPETRPFHYQLAQEADQFAVMDIPMDYWDRPANLLYQTVHQKPMVSGYTSRSNPRAPADRTPVLQTFRYLAPDINDADPRALAATVLSDLDVRYVIVHKNDLPPGDYRQTVLSTADDVFQGWPVAVDDDWLKVYRVPPPDARLPYVILGDGWAPREVRDGGPARALAASAATLLVRLPAAQAVRLEITAYSRDGESSLEVRSGEQVAGVYPLGGQPAVITTPAMSLPAGESVVELRAGPVPAKVVVTQVKLVVQP